MGGIAAYLGGTASIQNCRAALGIKLDPSSDAKHFAGGVVGLSSSTGTLKDIVCTAAVQLSNAKAVIAEDNNSYLGGIAGQCTVTSLDNCVFSGKVTVPTAQDNAKIPLYVGGLVGYFGADVLSKSPEIKNSRAGGTLEFLSMKGDSYSCIGGLVGAMGGNPTSEGNDAKIIASYYEGRITRDSVHAVTASFGGVVGKIGRNSSFESSYASSSAVISVSSAGAFSIGGFAGSMTDSGLSLVYSEAALTVENAFSVSMGGLIGDLQFYSGSYTVGSCYAKGNLSAIAGADLNMGGLIGYINNLTSESKISRCYAAANVDALNSGSGATRAGGLIGSASNIDVQYCYATGEVAANRSGSSPGSEDVYAAGLIGYLENTADSTIKNILECFAAGQVTANLAATTTDKVWGGGLIGYAKEGGSSRQITINKAAALGAKVTVTGGSDRSANRVLGGRSDNTYVTLQKLYARNNMRLAKDPSYDNDPDGDSVSAGDPTAIATDVNGVDAGPNTSFKTPSFWQNTINFTPADPAYWNFNAAVSRGYPTLTAGGGQ
jgi:hypothetical protein